MKSWKNRLNDEFENSVPQLKNEILNAPIVTTAAPRDSLTRNGNALIKRKVGIGSALVALFAATVIILLATFGVFKKGGTPADRYLFTLEINPAVAFITDEDGVVTGVNSLNEDADVVLKGVNVSKDILNKPLSEAIVTYTDVAAKTGYLDLTATKTAVKLTSTQDVKETVVKPVKESLQNYFMAKGVFAAVVQSTESVSDLSKKLGVNDSATLSELTDSLKDLSVCYCERVDANATQTDLKSLYEKYVLGAGTLEYVKKELLDNVEDIIDSAKILYDISSNNRQIMFSEDNPSLFPVDYWTVKKLYSPDKYTPEFAALMDDTERLIAEYKNKFNVAISGSNELTNAVEAYDSIKKGSLTMTFKEIFSLLSLTDLRSSIKTYVFVLKNIGYDAGVFESILEIPTTAEEYLSQFKSISDGIYNFKLTENVSVYEQERTAISSEKYEDFINKIIKDYGSLENFWKKIKK